MTFFSFSLGQLLEFVGLSHHLLVPYLFCNHLFCNHLFKNILFVRENAKQLNNLKQMNGRGHIV